MPDLTTQEILDSGVSPEMVAYAEEEGFQFHTVQVMDPCDCPMCKAGWRWFYCRKLDENHVETYISMGDGGPNPDDIEKIKDMHPGKDLIY